MADARLVKIREDLIGRILVIRGERVMIDADLAELYGVTTKALNQAVRRNSSRFPPDFVFQLTVEEKIEVVTNCDHLVRLKYSKALPHAAKPGPGAETYNRVHGRFRCKELTG